MKKKLNFIAQVNWGRSHSSAVCLFLMTALLALGFVKTTQAQCGLVVGDTVYVTSSANVAGSLRFAINCVNDPFNSIRFIHFDISSPGTIVITPTGAAPLPPITKDNVVIDARTQPGWFLGKVVIDGSIAGNSHGIQVSANNVAIHGLHITNFTNVATGGGILLNASGAVISENALSGNRYGIQSTSPMSFSVFDNWIGIDPSSGAADGNINAGINILTSALGNFQISNNTIAHNGTGIFAASNLVNVLASSNSIYCNSTKGIERSGFSVSGFAITSPSATLVEGTAPNGALIEIFSHDPTGCDPVNPPCQGKTLLGTTAASGGAWSLSLPNGVLNNGDPITATATIAGNNTSEFLPCSTVICGGLSIAFSDIQDACGITPTGEATATASGGGPFSYSWNSGQNTATASNLTPGTYTVVASDLAGCSITGVVTIDAAPMPTLAPSSNAPLCEGETLSLNANPSGGTPGYLFNWTGPDGFNSTASSPSLTSVTLSNGGAYQITATDSNGCTAAGSINISVNVPPIFDLSGQNITCNGEATGGIVLTPLMVNPPLSYNWSNGATTQNISNVMAGSYTVQVSDANGCQINDALTLTEPSAIEVMASANDASCGLANGTAMASANGGVGSFSFSWSNGQNGASSSNLMPGTYTVSATDQNNCVETESVTILDQPGPSLNANIEVVSCASGADGAIQVDIDSGTAPFSFNWNTGATTQNLSGLAAGLYSLTVTDVNNCTDVISLMVDEPNEMAIVFTTQNSSCGLSNGQAEAVVMGGTGTYTYNWSNGASGALIANLQAGTYQLAVSDSNNCSTTGTVAISNDDGPMINATAQPVSCAGASTGSIDLDVLGGAAPFDFDWSNGASSQDISNVPAGVYSVTVTDANNCAAVLTAAILEPQPLSLSIEVTNSNCGLADGSASASVSGGQMPYLYSWSNGGTNASIDNLSAGVYLLTVTDGNGCMAFEQSILVDEEGPVLSALPIDVLCHGASTGAIDLLVQGGSLPYTFSWSNGFTSEDMANLPAGAYTVTVTDGSNCQVILTTVIDQPLAMNLSNIQSLPPSGVGASDGQFSAQLNGGTSPYSYTWSGSASGSDNQNSPGLFIIGGLPAGNYSLTIEDANGCVFNQNFLINEVDCIFTVIVAQVNDESCAGAMDGSIELMTENGDAPFGYQWDNTVTTGAGLGTSITALVSGTYNITLTAADNCSAAVSATVNTTVIPIPATATQQACDIGNGQALFNLTALEATINPNPGYTVVWYEDALGQNEIADPGAFQSPGTQVYAALAQNACQSELSVITLVVLAPGSPACQGCITFAGTMNLQEVLVFCTSDPAAAVHLNDAILEPDDTLVFVLHTLAGEVLGDILAMNASADIAFEATAMETGITYYLSAVAGNSLPSGGIDLDDVCLSVSAGQAVVFSESSSGVLNFIQGEDLLCQGETLILSTNELENGIYHWITPWGDTLMTNEATLVIESVEIADAGDYYVFVQDENCLFDQTGPFTLSVLGLPPEEVIFAGNDTTICSTSFQLNASPVSMGIGQWTGSQIQNPNQASTLVSNLQPGENSFFWTVSTAVCGTVGTDTLTITVATGIDVSDDFFTLEQANSEIFMDVLKNDGLPAMASYELQALSLPQFGNLNSLENGFQYYENEGLRGQVYFDYQVCYSEAVCPEACDTARVYIEVLNLPFLPEGFSPNGDEVNDVLNVLGYRGGDDVTMALTITNRWGDVVYQTDDYLLENPWDGRSGSSGETLPEGTYYAWLVIEVEGQTYHQTQAIYLIK
ncbi:MAG TPA: gliding motility-associated C-terminal domain-containing protein [Saprospiraceae bacterium]|nr:gliding motility-associated C-terminal domain-containing protein [Saprospiraceae bacterium]HMQ83666.1 gliding motility-associated C-terminal domain-containing protein [Saprospiraceae bacterium]